MLARTPDAVRAMVGAIDPGWLTATEGPGTWSVSDVLAHMADLEEQDWPVRLRIVLEVGETTTFAPIDREAFRVKLAGRSSDDLIELFAARRLRNIRDLASRAIGSDDLQRRGTHPAFGTVTLGELLAAWVVHDLTHISQIARVLAKRYDHAVGPRREYLSILSRDGPSNRAP